MFKGLFNFIFGLIRWLCVLIILTLIFHTWVIKQVVTFSLSHQLGADVSVRNVKMDWKNTGFEIQGLEIGNPYNFPRGMLADFPLVIISVDLPSISQGILRLKTVGMDLRELQIMNAPQKGLNLLALKCLQEKNVAASSPSREVFRDQMNKIEPALVIDELIISIGDISYLDASGPSLKQNRFNVGIRGATYYDIHGIKDVTAILVNETLKRIGFGYLDTQLKKVQARKSSSGKAGFLSRLMRVFDEKSSD